MHRIPPRNTIASWTIRAFFPLILILWLTACRTPGMRPDAVCRDRFRDDPALLQGTLENGLRYVIRANREPRNRVSMHLVVPAGSIHETDDERGLAHYLEHMMFNGSRNFPPGELVRYFQSIGMHFGADANAHTGFYETVYDVLLPGGTREDLSGGLRVLRDYADGALLLPSEIDRERQVILAEKRDRDSADYRTFEATLAFELPDMRLSSRLPIGDETVIVSADRTRLNGFYRTWYRPDRMILVVVGDVDTTLVRSAVDEAFASLAPPAAPFPADPDPGRLRHEGIRPFYHFEKESGKTTVALEVLTQTAFEADSFDRRRDRLVARLADRMVQNRLDALTRRPGSPATSASVGSGTFLRHVRYGNISAECGPENWRDALVFIEQTLRQALEYGFTDQELDRVRQNLLAEMEQEVKSADTRNSSTLSSRIIRALVNRETVLSPEDNLALFGPVLEAVTLAEVNGRFRTTWTPDHRLILVTGNADLTGSAEPEQMIRSVYDAGRAQPVGPRPDEAGVTFPYLDEPAAKGAVVSREDLTDLGITRVVFDNGVVLNLKQTDFEAHRFLFRLIIGGGKADEPTDKPGLASLAMNLINESGFGALDKEDLKRALTGKTSRMSFSVAEDSFVLSGVGVPGETDLVFQLLRTQLLDPGFDEDAYRLTMERMAQNYEEMETTVEGMDDMKGGAFLAGGDPRFGLPPFERYRSNTVDDVRAWVGRSFEQDLPELSLVGDFDPDRVIDLAARYLGSLTREQRNASRPGDGSSALPRLPRGRSETFFVNTVIPKGLVKVCYATDDFWDIGRTRRLSVLAAVFSDRLRNRIREELGAAYSPYAYNLSSIAFPGYGVFQAVVTLDPEKADAVIAAIRAIADDLAARGISDDELRRAVDPILTSIRDMRRTNGYWLNSVLSGSGRHPVRLSWARTIEQDYAAVTTGDIHALAGRYLDNEGAACLRIMPGPAR
ncbi:insulinase family protein [Desulfatiferula olefinivorans]